MGDVFGELVWDMGTKTAIVLLLMYGALMLLRRFAGQQQSKRAGARIDLLSTAALGPGRSVHLITAGGKTLLVGATSQNVSLLAEFDGEAIEETPEPAVPSAWTGTFPGVVSEFSEKLAKVWQTRRVEDESGGKRKGNRRGGRK